MVRNYNRKSERHSWSSENIMSAVNKVINDKIAIKTAALNSRVLKSTLQDRLKELKGGTNPLDTVNVISWNLLEDISLNIRNIIWFQLDGAAGHFERSVRNYLNKNF